LAFNRQTFATRLRDALTRAELHNADVARALQINPNRVSEWVTARQVPKLEQLSALARFLDVDLHWLITGRDRTATGTAVLIDELVRATPTLQALAERGHELAARRPAP
jgi:transcriptional regulator with XRE-family HTH domain